MRFMSVPLAWNPLATADTTVVPLPMNGSFTDAGPSGRYSSNSVSTN
jgi:hypothetical protein